MISRDSFCWWTQLRHLKQLVQRGVKEKGRVQICLLSNPENQFLCFRKHKFCRLPLLYCMVYTVIFIEVLVSSAGCFCCDRYVNSAFALVTHQPTLSCVDYSQFAELENQQKLGIKGQKPQNMTDRQMGKVENTLVHVQVQSFRKCGFLPCIGNSK